MSYFEYDYQLKLNKNYIITKIDDINIKLLHDNKFAHIESSLQVIRLSFVFEAKIQFFLFETFIFEFEGSSDL